MTLESMELGRTGFKVTRLCFGGWQAQGWVSSDDKNFIATLRYALERGINFIDTAEAYGDGHSERLIGQAIKGRRESIILATKFWYTHSKAQQVRASLEGSLKRLGTDYIDLYQQHWPPPQIPLEETISELLKLKEEGKIRAIGVSNWMEPEWSEIKDPSHIECLQPCYSLLWRSIEKKVLPLCREHGIAVIPYSPLCQGLLTGRFKSAAEVPADFRKQNRLFSAAWLPKVLRIVDELLKIAAELEKPPAAVALRWLLDQPGITAAIAGASSRAQVDENMEALGWTLPKDTVLRLSEASADLSAGLKPHETMWNWHPRGT